MPTIAEPVVPEENKSYWVTLADVCSAALIKAHVVQASNKMVVLEFTAGTHTDNRKVQRGYLLGKVQFIEEARGPIAA